MFSRIMKIIGSAVLAVALAIPGGHASDSPATASKAAAIPATLVGTLTYRERIALPPGSEALVELRDVSRADAPSTTIAEQRIAIGGQVPIHFRLDYDAAVLDPKHTYAVSARITNGGRLLFISDTMTQVITRGNPLEADLVLKKVSDKQ